ncbi:unnamed protein product [Didymodactylos carnosus]|uniref:Cupin type-2 domain-containing protein n=1 Tax=Didymodactylos carnosus TaxID=1234261 RepID=A0A814HN24_9BILA|nr:unnamed protein product [Didymodactylos carnosus]CAF1557893.1 unnamed protein product [Didymodactylos carnosus]CAF3783663.1 unnamed protein product [Didymodactylos carnosus]CAF4349125.1 unnamed protein product [Didymodactylos carnosus]
MSNQPFSWVKNGEGQHYGWSQDSLFVKVPSSTTNGELSIVEDTLKPNFFLARHHHKIMTEIFYVVEGQVEFIFDNQTIMSNKGDTIVVPPNTWHAAKCEKGGKMLTIFRNGQFDVYLAKLVTMTDADFKNDQLVKGVDKDYDIYKE